MRMRPWLVTSELESMTQIDLAYPLVAQDVLRRALGDDTAVAEDIGA